VDYYKVFEGIELNDYDFLKYIVLDDQIPSELKNAINRQVKTDNEFFKDMLPPLFLRKRIISNLDRDVLVSMWLQSAITLDSRHFELIKKKCEVDRNFKLNGSPVTSAIREFLSFPSPDFTKMTMQDVLELREKRGWRELRNTATGLIATIQEDPQLFNDPIALEKEISYQCKSAMMDELRNLHPSNRETAIDLVLCGASLLPAVGMIPTMIGAGKTIYKHLDKSDNWTGYLLKLKDFH
jgi:hypothetical protein